MLDKRRCCLSSVPTGSIGLYAGPLPKSWNQLKNLTTLYGYLNHFTGPLPPGWANMSSLYSFNVPANKVCLARPLRALFVARGRCLS